MGARDSVRRVDPSAPPPDQRQRGGLLRWRRIRGGCPAPAAGPDEATRKRLDEILSSIYRKGVDYHALIFAGDPADEIIELTKESGTDLVVISKNDKPGLKPLIFGSVVEKVARSAACPVLVVH